MGAIAAPDRALLRQPVDTQTSKESLYFFGFPTLWTGRVNEAPDRGDRSITYDGGAMAAGFGWAEMANYWAGLEVWFGSAAGLKDRGVRRLRSMGAAEAAGTLVTDWYDDIDLQNDDYITIKHFYPPWPRYSWFTATGPEFRKDGPDGTTYAASGAANETPAPHVIMGRHYAGEMPAVGNLSIQCDATNSVDVAGGGGPVTYAWAVRPSGTASFNNPALGAPVLTITAPGRYWIHCTVTIGGRSTTAHRAVIVGGGITEFSRSPISHQYDSTDVGVSLTLTGPETGAGIRGTMTWADVQDHTLAVITAEDWYGTTQKTISFRDDGVYDDRQHVVFCGYLTLENMDLVEDGTGAVELQAVSLVDMFLYSLSLTGMTAVDEWYEMINTQMTVAGNLLHLLRWHSTLLDDTDWWLPWGDAVRRSANEEFSEGDMLERARALARARLMAITANPQGEIFVETDLNMRSAAERAAETTTLTLTEADVAGTKRARTRRRSDLVRVLADGGYSAGVMGSFQPFFAASQNVAKSDARPALVHVDRLMLPSQAEANRVAARLQAVANRRYIEVNLDLAGNYREVFSPADQQWTNLGNLFAASLQANISGDTGLVNARCVPRQVTHTHDNATGQTTISAIFDVEAPVELGGQTITPPSVPTEDPDDNGWDFPGPPEWPVIPGVTLLTNLLAFVMALGCWLRFAGAADWIVRNGVRAGTDDDDLQGGWDPWWFTPVKANTSDVNQSILWACQVGKIWRSEDGGQTWQDMTVNIPDPPNDFNQTPAPTADTVTYVQRVDSIHQNGLHVFSVEYFDGAIWGAWLLSTNSDGSLGSWTYKALGSVGLTATFGFDAGTEGWEFFDESGDGATGSYNPSVGRTAPGCLQIDSPAVVACWSQWRYPPVVGLQVATGDTLSAWVNHNGDNTTNNWCSIFYTDGTHTASNIIHQAAGWNQVSLTVPAGANGKVIESIRLHADTGTGGNAYTAYWDDVSVSIAGGQVRPIWADIDSQSGSVLWLTLWRGNNTLVLQKRNTGDLALVTEYTMGSCTLVELTSKTYWCAPFTPTFDALRVYCFGRMAAPAGLAGTQHIIRSVTGGANWASVESSWGADYCGALQVVGQAAPRTMYAVRNRPAPDNAEFYVGPEGGSLAFRSDLPFDVGIGVNVDALTLNAAGQVAAGASGASVIMVCVSDPPYGTWTDITDSLPGAEVRSLAYV